MDNLTLTLLQRVNSLTTVVNAMISQAESIAIMDAAGTIVGTDYFEVSQGGISKRALASDVLGVGSGLGVIAYGDWLIFKASGNSLETLESGDIVQGWFSPAEFWAAAIYNSGDEALRTSYTELLPFTEI